MLSDRDYMRPNTAFRDVNSGRRAVWVLIAINVFAFILIPQRSELYHRMAMIPALVEQGYIYQLFTAMFMHGGIAHLLFNMWGLYLFGMLVAPHLGAAKFVGLYLISGLFGNLLFWTFNAGSMVALVGASGSLFGIMLACAMLEPNREFMMLFFPTPIKCKTMVIVYAVIEIIFMGNNDGIAHLAHLGGFVGGYIFMHIIFRRNQLPWDLMDLFHRKGPGASRPNVTFSTPPSHSQGKDIPLSQRELDRLLDKISEQGINSLTPEELATLRRAREHLRQR